jgi:hypothetical protein
MAISNPQIDLPVVDDNELIKKQANDFLMGGLARGLPGQNVASLTPPPVAPVAPIVPEGPAPASVTPEPIIVPEAAPMAPIPVTPAPMAQPMGAESLMRSALNKETQIAEKMGQGEMQLLEQAQLEQEQRAKQREEEIARKQELTRQKRAELDENLVKIGAAEAEAKKDYWADKSTGTRIAAAIFSAMGAYSSALTGGKNTAMDIINNAIERDADKKMQAVKFAREKNKDIADQYDSLFAVLGDESAVRDAILANNINKVELGVKKLASQYKGANQQAQADKIMSEFALKKEEALASAAAKAAERRSVEDEKYVPALGSYALTKEGAAKLNEESASVLQVKDNLARLRQIAQTPAKSLSPELRAEADTLTSFLKAALRKPIVGEGAVNESEWKLLNDIVANPTSIFSLDATNLKRLEAIETRVQRNFEKRAESYGIRTNKAPATQENAMFMVKGNDIVKVDPARMQDMINIGYSPFNVKAQ